MVRILEFGMSSADKQGGVESYLINQYRHFDKNKIWCDFISQGNSEIAYQEEIERNGSDIYNIYDRRKNPIKCFLYAIKLMYVISGKYDVFIMNFGGIPTCGFMFFLAYLARIPTRIAHAHASGLAGKRNFLKRFMDNFDYFFVKKFATDYWACSVPAGKFMFKDTDFEVIKNGIEVDKFKFSPSRRNIGRKKLCIGDDCIVVGSVGRIVPIKNYLFLIDVFFELHHICPNSKLMIVGDFRAKENEKYVKEVISRIEYHGLSNDVILHPFTERISDLYQVFDVFVMTSIKEGLPLVSVEAQAAGLPCLLSTGIPDEAVILPDSTKRLSLEDSHASWAREIFKLKDIKRFDTTDLVRKAGFDVVFETKRVEGLLGLK